MAERRSSLLVLRVLIASTFRAEDVLQPVIPLVTRVLKHAVGGISLQWKRDRPWLRPRLRVVDGCFVLNCVGVDPREALDEVDRVARVIGPSIPGDASLAIEIRRLNNESVAFPVAPCI